MDPTAFLDDLERKPDVLAVLADRLAAGSWPPPVPSGTDRVLLVGMGSSTYAAGVAAARMRAAGLTAVADLASSDLLPPAEPGTLVVAISASGGSRETLGVLPRYAGRAPVLALTNLEGSAVTQRADAVWPLLAGPEEGGVACRTYQHTLVALLALAELLADRDPAVLAGLVRDTAAACADLLDRRPDWLPQTAGLLGGPAGTAVVAPARRLGSAQQSALMLREGPRRAAVACETGDWSHVDVYLTKTQDYRMLLLPGSVFEDELFRWTQERGSTVVVAGGADVRATACVRYVGDEDDDVRLLAEVLVAELVAQRWWAGGGRR